MKCPYCKNKPKVSVWKWLVYRLFEHIPGWLEEIYAWWEGSE